MRWLGVCTRLWSPTSRVRTASANLLNGSKRQIKRRIARRLLVGYTLSGQSKRVPHSTEVNFKGRTLIATQSKRTDTEAVVRIGYVRVSSDAQKTDRQEIKLKTLDVEKIFIDKASGKSTDRPELKKMMEYIREGDTVIVESISRFARSTRDLLELMSILDKKDVKFISEKEAIDTATPTGRFMLTVFAAVAELEREYLRDRQREGIELAKQQGKYKGRRPGSYPDLKNMLEKTKRGEITAAAAMRKLGMSKTTWYRKIKEF